MSEEWRPVVGFEGLYEVSDQGRVRSLDREVRSGPGRTRKARSHILKPSAGQDGYLRVNLWQDNQYRSRTVHSVVAESFFGFVSGKEVRHLDGNKGNCSKTNLVLDSRRQNTLDRKWVDGTKKLLTATAGEIQRRSTGETRGGEE